MNGSIRERPLFCCGSVMAASDGDCEGNDGGGEGHLEDNRMVGGADGWDEKK